jgi:hypothetical protein
MIRKIAQLATLSLAEYTGQAVLGWSFVIRGTFQNVGRTGDFLVSDRWPSGPRLVKGKCFAMYMVWLRLGTLSTAGSLEPLLRCRWSDAAFKVSRDRIKLYMRFMNAVSRSCSRLGTGDKIRF